MPIEQFQVDAFTAVPFRGNPAAILVLDQPAPEPWMQALAGENNLSETAYLTPVAGGWSLRWFTPTVEVDLCGHATLAAAHVLFSEPATGGPPPVPGTEVRFTTRSGWLGATLRPEGWIQLDFPADPPTVGDPPDGLLAALGLEAEPGTVLEVATGRLDLLVRVTSPAAVRACRPDHRALRSLGARGVIVTAAGGLADPTDQPVRTGPAAPAEPADAAAHVVSRFFAPGSGIDEDPVTGSAHCTLTPFWAERLGRTSLLAHQASARGGDLRCELVEGRVTLAGQAVTVLRARLAPAAAPPASDAPG